MAKPVKPTTHDLVTVSLVRAMTAEEFADFCFPARDTSDTRRFFDVIQWPEGYGYCASNRGYALHTGFLCVKNSINSLLDSTSVKRTEKEQ